MMTRQKVSISIEKVKKCMLADVIIATSRIMRVLIYFRQKNVIFLQD